ncbi:MAG: hypothetical protein E6G56_14075 [Actinobacteria bacterium]|nr:MAG: hypothetical protein E6G56_14075 [Actinomycetota bacterium]
MADWATISSLATAGGTLVLAVATFASVRSANRSARLAELSLLTGLRPVLIPSRADDPVERIRFVDGQVLEVPGHGASFEVANGNIYLAIGLRNGGAGLAVIHGWRVEPREVPGSAGMDVPEVTDFRRQQRDLYIPAGDSGFWQGAIRDHDDRSYESMCAAAGSGAWVMVDLLYGDHEGGQRTIARFGISPADPGGGYEAQVSRYWNVDRADPR